MDKGERSGKVFIDPSCCGEVWLRLYIARAKGRLSDTRISYHTLGPEYEPMQAQVQMDASRTSRTFTIRSAIVVERCDPPMRSGCGIYLWPLQCPK